MIDRGSHSQDRFADVEVESVRPDGDGVATLRGRRVTIPFTIPGERVRIKLPDTMRRDARVTLLEVLRPSPHRVAPKCGHFGLAPASGVGPCGGCTWQHISYSAQLRLKADLVDRLVRAVVPQAPAARPTLAATSIDHPWGYRNKVHFVFGTRASALSMGHYARASRRVVPVSECPVHDARGNTFAFAARDMFVSAGVQAADQEHGTLRSLAVRVGRGTTELMAALVVSNERDRRLRAATRRLLDESLSTSMHLNVHARDDAFIFGPSTRHLQGSARMREVVGGASFLISPAAFFQTNVAAAEILVRLVLDAIEPPRRVLDLYAGSGLFAIPLALAGNDVTAVEENRTAVADGEAALKLNSAARERCRFLASRAETALRSLRKADVVVLDPPREGCSPAVLREVFQRLTPMHAIYVSCNPEALARDLRQICRAGYRVGSVQPVDMFPHTAHVEAVVVLRR